MKHISKNTFVVLKYGVEKMSSQKIAHLPEANQSNYLFWSSIVMMCFVDFGGKPRYIQTNWGQQKWKLNGNGHIWCNPQKHLKTQTNKKYWIFKNTTKADCTRLKKLHDFNFANLSNIFRIPLAELTDKYRLPPPPPVTSRWQDSPKMIRDQPPTPCLMV